MILFEVIFKMSLPQSSIGIHSTHFPQRLPDKETLWQNSYIEAFQKNYESVQRWTRWKEDHEAVKTALSTLPDQLSHEVVIPFGTKALVKAKLVHTNEILTSIGGSYFVKQSAKQGIALCDRRISDSEEMLKKLEGERTLLSNRQTLPKLEEAFPDDTKEIIEEYNEEAEAEWRKQHRKKEAEYRRKLADLREKQRENPQIKTEEDIFRRLDELELEEELNDELERLHAEYEADYENNNEDDDGESSEDEETGDSDNGDSVKIPIFSKQSSTVVEVESDNVHSVNTLLHNRKEINTDIHCSKSSKSLDIPSSSLSPLEAWGENSSVKFETGKKSRRISFADESQKLPVVCKDKLEEVKLDERIYVRFQHSNEPPKQPLSQSASLRMEKDESSLYLTPADIYNSYKSNLKSPSPKSILKKSSSYPDKFQNKKQEKPIQTSASFGSEFGLKSFSSSEEDEDVTVNYQQARDLSHLPPVLCDVQESTTKQLQRSAQEPSQRPVSQIGRAHV